MTAEVGVRAPPPRADRILAVGGRLRLASIALLIGIGAWLAWRIVGDVVVAKAPPDLALTIRPRSATALTAAAKADFAAGRPDAALTLAQQALRQRPFNELAARVAAQALEAKGQGRRAEQLMTLAGNWSLRDDPAQFWLIHQRLLDGDYASAFAHLDALLRRKLSARPTLFKLIAATLSRDGAHSMPALAARLRTNPPWREDLFRVLSADPATVDAAAQLALSQRGGPAPVTAAELSAPLNTLAQTARYADALRLWTAVWPGAATAGTPANGRFAPLSGPAPFEWSLVSGAGGGGADIVRDESNRTALRAQYDGDAPATFLRALMVLPPGHYRLTGAYRTEGGGADRMAWSISCADQARPLAQIAPPGGDSNNWRPFAGDFTTPAQVCQGQWLSLVGRPADRAATVAVWFRDLRVALQ